MCLRQDWPLVGATVAKAICTPLRKQDSIVLYDAATGQKLQSSCRGSPLTERQMSWKTLLKSQGSDKHTRPPVVC